MDNINIGLRSFTIILIISTFSFIAGSNINCNGKAFHCVNSTHFKICVDLGHGVSTTVDEFLIPCPQNTVCKQYNLFECEFELTTTLPPVKIQSEVTNEKFKTIDSFVSEQLDITTLFPTIQQDGMQLSEKYYNKVNATPASLTKSFLTDVLIDSVNTSNTIDLHTSSNGEINKTLNNSPSTDKELTSITESGIDVTQSLYNINTLQPDIGVRTKYNTETPVFSPTTQVRKTMDSFKSESLEPSNQNSLDLDASYTVTKRTNQVSSVSEWRNSAVTLLPVNFSDPSLQENIPGITNINHSIKSDNTSQDNLDILIKYNTTQLNNSVNNTQYRNIENSMYTKNTSSDVNTLNSTPFNVITDEIFTSDVSDINKKSKVNSVVMLKPSRQYLAEITTASTTLVPRTTNQFSSHIFLNTEVIETFFSDGFNNTTRSEKLSVSDGDIMSSIIPETSVAKINNMSGQITKSGFNYDVSSFALTKSILDEKNAISTNKPLVIVSVATDFNNNNTTITEESNNITAEISNGVTSLEPITDVISKNVTRPKPVLVSVATDLDNNNITTTEITNNVTAEISNGVTSLEPISDLISKNATRSKPVMVTVATDIDNINITTTEVTNNITAEISNGVTSLEPITDVISKNVTRPKPVMVSVATDLDNNNITTTEVTNNITSEIYNGVTSLEPITDVISKNVTRPKPVMVSVATDIDNINITTTEVTNNLTAEISNGVTSLEPITDVISKNVTRPKPVLVSVATDLDNNNITTTEVTNNVTAEISNGVTSFEPITDVISKNVTRPKPVMVSVATDLDNNNITTTEVTNNITSEIYNGVTSLEPITDVISKNVTRPKPVLVSVATDLDNNNITTTEVTNNVTAEISNVVTSLEPITDVISKNVTRPKPVMVSVATDLDNNNITTTEVTNNITSEIYNGVTSLEPITDVISKNATRPKPVLVSVATDLDNNNITTTEVTNNVTAEISNGVTSFEPITDVISKNVTRPKLVLVSVATDLDNNNITTTEVTNNVTAEISNGVTSFEPITDVISKNVTRPKPVMVSVATDLDNNNITTTEVTNNITSEIYNGVTSLEPITDVISKNVTRPKPVLVSVATDLDNNNITTTEVTNNVTAEISNVVTSLEPITDVISKNVTRPKPVMVSVATDLDNNNITTTEVTNNITSEIYNGVTSLEPITDVISKNATRPKPVLVSVATDLDNNNITTTEVTNNVTAEISNGVTSFEPITDVISKNVTRPKPVMVSVATDLDNNNITTTEVTNNITSEIYNGVTSLEPITDVISKNATRPKPVLVSVATDLDNNNITTTEVTNNVTAEISNGVTSFEPITDVISKNVTRPKPVMVSVATDLDNNNITTTEVTNNITSEIYNGVTSLEPITDVISKNATRPKPVLVSVATDLDNNNITTTEVTNNVTAEISNGVTSFEPITDVISKNVTRPKPVMVSVATDLDNNNITTTEVTNNITSEIYNGVTSLEPITDVISKNATRPKPVLVSVATDLDNNNITTTEVTNNVTAEISNGVTSFEPITDVISKNVTRPKPVLVSVATDLDNNNITTTEVTNNITSEIYNGVTSLEPITDVISKNETRPKPVLVTVATDLDNNNITTTEVTNNLTAKISNGVTSLISISNLVSKNITSSESVATNTFNLFPKVNIFKTNSTIFTDHQSLDKSSSSLSSLPKTLDNTLKSKHFNMDSEGLISSTDSVIRDLEQNTSSSSSTITNLPINLDKLTTLTNRSSGAFDNNNTTLNTFYLNKPIFNALYEINKSLSSNYTHKDNNNRISEVYQITTENDRAFVTVKSFKSLAVYESPNSTNVTNNTFSGIDILSDHRVVSNYNNNIKNTSKSKESKITTKPLTYFDSNKNIIHVISSEIKNETTLSSQSAKNETNTKQVIYNNTIDNIKIVGKANLVNPNFTKPTPENKLVTSNNFSLSPAFYITYINNNNTDKNNNSLKDLEINHYQVKNNLVEKISTVGVNNTYLNDPYKNAIPSVSNNSQSVPLIYLHKSITKPQLTDIYNVSDSYFREYISQIFTINQSAATHKNHETEGKESNQTNKNGFGPADAVSIMKHERNKTEYIQLNPYTQVNTAAIKVNDTTLKELTYNFSEPSFSVRNNVKHDIIMKNITSTDDKNTAPKGFYNTKGSGFDKTNSTTTIKSVNTNNCTNYLKLADNLQLSEISNSQLSGSIIKPLQEVKNTSSLHPENGNLFSDDILNKWGVFNTTLVANNTKPTKTFTQEENVSEVNNLTFIRTTEKYIKELNATSESNITAHNLLRNTLPQNNTIKNETHVGMSSNGREFSRIPSEFDKFSQSTGLLEMEKTPFVSNRTKLEIITDQEKNSTSDHTNQSKGIAKKQLTNGHGHSESYLTITNGVTKNIRNHTQNSFSTKTNNNTYPNTHYGKMPTNQEFRCTKRGKFSDTKDCNKFFVCIGRVQPVIGLCPIDSVFSEYLKQCTKNVTHCIRNNEFKCIAAGRFINILYNNTYFVCARKKSSFIRFTFQCQKGYYLDKNNVKCTPELNNISVPDINNSKNTKELSFDKSEEMEGVSINSKNIFECEKEGKFQNPEDCRKYYVCKKGTKSIYRRKIKQCDSDEVFHKKEKKCVDAESYECDI